MSSTSPLTRRAVLRLGAGAAGGLLLSSCAGGARGCGASDPRPNVLLLVADDLGPECLGAYGGRSFATPHLDALAREGMRLTSAFATPACAPSRAELLTGRYPFRTGWIDNAGPLSPPFLSPEEPTFARTLADAGYATAIAGKWQLGSLTEHPRMPQDSGFEESCCWSLERVGNRLAMTPGNARYFRPRLWQNGALLEVDERSYGPEIEFAFLTDFMTRNVERPFLAYHAMNLPHAPYHVPPGWESRVAPQADPQARAAALYGVMIEYMDDLVGRYVRLLEELGIERRTLIVFTSDNGGNENFVVRTVAGEVRGGKFQLDDRGANVAFLLRQPGVVPAGTVRDDLLDFTDVLVTLADLGRAPLPTGVRLDGTTFRPVLTGEGPSARRWVYVQLGRQAFIRDARFRLATSGRLYRVTGSGAEEPADPRAGGEARRAWDSLRAALLELLGDERNRVWLAPALVRGEPPGAAPAKGRGTR